MTTAQAITKFDILEDKYGSAYLTADEKIEFLNMAQLEVLNRMIPDSAGGVVNFETDSNTLQNLSKLIITNTGYPVAGGGFGMNASGILSETDINNSLVSVSGDANAKLFRIISIGYTLNGVTRPAKFVKYNTIWKNVANVFKQPTESNLRYTVVKSNTGVGIQFFPIITSAALHVSIVKTPLIMTASNSPDWDDYMMNQVIFQALKLAGVSIRDEELIADVRNTGIQAAQ